MRAGLSTGSGWNDTSGWVDKDGTTNGLINGLTTDSITTARMSLTNSEPHFPVRGGICHRCISWALAA